MHARQATRLLGAQVASARHQQPQFDVQFGLSGDGAQVRAGAHLLGNDSGIARIALGLPADRALAGAIDGQPWHVHQRQAGLQQHGLRQRSDASQHINAHALWRRQRQQLDDELLQVFWGVEKLAVEDDLAARVDSTDPVHFLGDIDADRRGHWHSPSRSIRQPFLANFALHSDDSQSLISGREGKAERGEMPPEPSQAASMKAIPSRRLESILACHSRHRSLGNEKGRAA